MSNKTTVSEAQTLIAEAKVRSRKRGERDVRHMIMYDVKALFRHAPDLDELPVLAQGQADDLVFEHLDNDVHVGCFRIWRNRMDEGPRVSMEVLVDGRWITHEAD
jgi:hypothetical protein